MAVGCRLVRVCASLALGLYHVGMVLSFLLTEKVPLSYRVVSPGGRGLFYGAYLHAVSVEWFGRRSEGGKERFSVKGRRRKERTYYVVDGA